MCIIICVPSSTPLLLTVDGVGPPLEQTVRLVSKLFRTISPNIIQRRGYFLFIHSIPTNPFVPGEYIRILDSTLDAAKLKVEFKI